MNNNNDFYTTTDLCERLHICTATFHNLRKRGILPPSIHPTRYRVLKAEFDKWLDNGGSKYFYYYTSKDVCKLLDIDITTFKHYLNTGILPPSHISSEYRVGIDDFKEWCDNKGADYYQFYNLKQVRLLCPYGGNKLKELIDNGTLPPSIHPKMYRVGRKTFDEWYDKNIAYNI